jgi:hypothetical protein
MGSFYSGDNFFGYPNHTLPLYRVAGKLSSNNIKCNTTLKSQK